MMKFRMLHTRPSKGAVLALCVALLNAVITPVFSQSASPSNRLRAGDGVRIMVWKDLDNQARVEDMGIAGDQLIDASGNILVPGLGEVKAAGLTAQTLAEVLQQQLEIKKIRIVCAPLIRVTVLGAVQRPGSYLVQPKESLWELITKAGSPANDADVRKIQVIRSGRKVNENLLEAFEKAHSLEQMGVQSGDQVVVPGHGGFNVDAFFRYATFAMSVGIFYLALSDPNRN